MLITTIVLRDLAGHGSLQSLGSPEVAGSAEDQETGWTPGRTASYTIYLFPIPSLWGSLTSPVP